MQFSDDCQGIFGHFRKFSDSASTQLSQIGPVYPIGCVGADFFIGSDGEAYECELQSGVTRDRTHGGKTFPLVAKASLKRRGAPQSRGTDFAWGSGGAFTLRWAWKTEPFRKSCVNWASSARAN